MKKVPVDREGGFGGAVKASFQAAKRNKGKVLIAIAVILLIAFIAKPAEANPDPENKGQGQKKGLAKWPPDPPPIECYVIEGWEVCWRPLQFALWKRPL